MFYTASSLLLFETFSPAQERGVAVETITGRKFAFLVGVAEYEYSNNWDSLPNTIRDVQVLQKQLESLGFDRENIIVMASNTSVSRQPTKRKIIASLNELLEKVTADDIIICMFAGHGTQNGNEQLFCPEDARLDDLSGSCVSLNEVLDALKQSPAKFKWLIVDACRNPLKRSASGGTRSIGKLESIPKGVTAIFSCAESQESYEHPIAGHGAFSHFLIQGLAGAAADKNGVVSILDLYKYVQKETREYVELEYKKDQIPYWDGEFTNFILRDDLLIEGVSREQWFQADAAYKQAQEYRRKKEYANAVTAIKKALAILPDKGEFLDEKQMIELLASNATPTAPVRPEPPTGQSQTTPPSVAQGTQSQESPKPNLVIPSMDKPEEWIAPLRELKRDDIKPVVDTARHVQLVIYADEAQDSRLYSQAKKDFFASLVPNFSEGSDRIWWVEEILPV